MKVRTDADMMVGKTVAGWAADPYGKQMVISFTDGTFSLFEIESGYDSGDECIRESHELRLDTTTGSYLVDAKVVTKAELEEAQERRRQSVHDRWVAREREQFERLKRKYGEDDQ